MMIEANQAIGRIVGALHSDNNFPEWIHPKTKESFGVDQAWSAGTFILAQNSVETKKMNLFNQ